MGRIADETLSGLKWTFLQKAALQPAQFIYGIILAHLVSPREMGILGLTAIFFAIAATLAGAGFGSALIRKLDRTEADCSTMFWFNAFTSLLLSSVLFLSAPWFVVFFNQAELLWLTRASAILMFIGSLSSVHLCLYTCRRDFKTPAIVNAIVSLLSMPICLYLAYIGWGVWALMTQQIFSSILTFLIIWTISPWRPRFLWSGKSFSSLFGFGSKLALSSLIDVAYNNLRTFFIGKVYSPEQLGLFNRGKHLTDLPVNLLLSNLNSVAYPVLATIQNDDERLIRAYRKYNKLLSMCIFFGVLLMGALAKPLVSALYGPMWAGCVIYTQILCFSLLFWHLHVINLAILQVKGRSDLFLRLEIIKKAIGLIALLTTIRISVEAMCWATAITTQLCLVVNTYYTGKLFDYSYKKQWGDFLPYLFLSAGCSIPAWGITRLPISVYIQLPLGALASTSIYMFILILKKDETLLDVHHLLKEKGTYNKIPFLKKLFSSPA